jgi:hypothetical protein
MTALAGGGVPGPSESDGAVLRTATGSRFRSITLGKLPAGWAPTIVPAKMPPVVEVEVDVRDTLGTTVVSRTPGNGAICDEFSLVGTCPG